MQAGPGRPQPEPQTEPQPDRTLWRPLRKTPLRQFLQTETGSAAILTGAVLAALIWANVSSSTYQQVWGTELAARVGGHGMSMDLRTFVNSGLMTLFFLVVGLEARRARTRCRWTSWSPSRARWAGRR